MVAGFWARERLLWHKHFIPSLLAGLAVGLVSFLYEMTASNIILFASVGASAAILAHSHSHHLTRLHTTVTAYLISILLSILVYGLDRAFHFPLSVNLFLIVLLVTLGMFLADAFHPPAVSAGMSFILLERPILDLLFLFLTILVLMVAIRFFTYTFSQHLNLKEFMKEFGGKI